MTLVGMWNALILLGNAVLAWDAGYYAYHGQYDRGSFCLILVLLAKLSIGSPSLATIYRR